VVLAAAHLLGIAFHRIGQPRVNGRNDGGNIAGSIAFGTRCAGFLHAAFSLGRIRALNELSQIGLILFLFVVGIEARPHEDKGLAGHALAASSASMLTPLLFGALLAIPLHRDLGSDVPLAQFVLFTGAAMSITAFPVLARILTERGLLHSRAGAIAISCAAVDDVAAWCLVALLMAASATAWLLVIAGLAVYAAAMLLVLRPLLRDTRPILPRRCSCCWRPVGLPKRSVCMRCLAPSSPDS